MNWTGGGLSRAGQKGARKGIGLTARQKEHYAKARNGNTKKKFPSQPAATERGSAPRRKQATARIGGRDEDVFHDGTPLPRATKRTRGDGESGFEERVRHDDECIVDVGRIKQELSMQQPVPEENYCDATPPPRRLHQDIAKARGEGTVQEEHKYLATPPLRKRTGQIQNAEIGNNTGDDAISEKRRKLLLQDDWMGLHTHKLQKTRFVVPKQDANIGRRRKVRDAHRARYRTSQSIIASPFRKNTRHRIDDSYPNIYDLETGNSQMRISIGEAPGLEQYAPSISVPRKDSVMMLSQGGSEDMLLQERNRNKENPGTSTSGTYLGGSWNGISTSLEHHSSARVEVASREGDWRKERKYEAATEKSYEKRFYGSSIVSSRGDSEKYGNENKRRILRVTPEFIGLETRNFRPSQDTLPCPPQARDISLRPDNQQMLVSSSSNTTVHHPQPTRSDTRKFLSRIIRSTSSEHENPIVTEQDQHNTNEPTSSEAFENAIWDSWAVAMESGNPLEEETIDGRDYHTELPRNSVISNSRLSVNSFVSFDVDENQELQKNASVILEKSKNDSHLGLKYGSTRADAGLTSPLQEQLLSQFEEIHSEKAAKYTRKEQYPNPSPQTIGNHRERNGYSPKDTSTKTENSNEAWRRFACGTPSDDTHNNTISVTKNAVSTLGPAPGPASSMLVRYSVESTARFSTSFNRDNSIDSSMAVQDSVIHSHQVSSHARQMHSERETRLGGSQYDNTSRAAHVSSESIHGTEITSHERPRSLDREPAGDSIYSEDSRPESVSFVQYPISSEGRSSVQRDGSPSSNTNEKTRIIFLRPERFVGNGEMARERRGGRRILHIGRGLVGNDRRSFRAGKFGEENSEDELESIEDEDDGG